MNFSVRSDEIRFELSFEISRSLCFNLRIEKTSLIDKKTIFIGRGLSDNLSSFVSIDGTMLAPIEDSSSETRLESVEVSSRGRRLNGIKYNKIFRF